MKQKYFIGQEVKVNLKEIPIEERNCDVGVIMGINLFYRNTPFERINYYVRFNKPYIKPDKVILSQIYYISAPESLITDIV